MNSRPPQKCYFTLLDYDSISESVSRARRAGSDAARVKSKLKAGLRAKLQAAVLLHDEVIFRATAVLTSPRLPIARELIHDARVLIDSGVLVPEVRGGDEPLAKQLRDRPAQFELDAGEVKEFLPLAEVIDGAPKKHEPDAVVLSNERSLQLIDHLFQLYCHRRQINFLKNRSLSCAELERLFSLLLESRPVARNEFRDKCKLLYKVTDKARAERLIQTIYYGVGALTARADAFLPEQLNHPGGLYPETNLDGLPKRTRKLADKFGIDERLTRTRNLILVGDNFLHPDAVLSELGVSKFESFEWDDILSLHRSGDTERARHKIYRLTQATTPERPLGLEPQSPQAILDAIRKAKFEEGERLKRIYSGIKDAADLLPVALPPLSLLFDDPRGAATYLALVSVISYVSSWVGVAGVGADRSNILGYFTPFESFKNAAEKIERKYH